MEKLTGEQYRTQYTKGRRDFTEVDLSSANLSSANLSSANLCYADLNSADLSSADLSSADLSSADLSSANLRSANLRSANLSYADLRSANLSYADLRSARYNIFQVFCCHWGNVSDILCMYFMRIDASTIPNGNKLMNTWSNGGACPYSNINYQRVVNFKEKKENWKPGKVPNMFSLWKMLAKEKDIKIDV